MKKIFLNTLSLILFLLLTWQCNNTETIPSQSNYLEVDGTDVNLKNVSVLNVTGVSNPEVTTYKIVVTPDASTAEIEDVLPENALYIEVSADANNKLKGRFGFNYLETEEGFGNKIIYAMMISEGKVIGITDGSIEIKEVEESVYQINYDLVTENNASLKGEMPIDICPNELGTGLKAATDYCSGCNDNYNGNGLGVTSSEALAMAKRYAPIWKFDNAASTFPDNITTIWKASGNKSCGSKLTLDDRSIITKKNLNFNTYFDVQVSPEDDRRVFIDYWVIYARQPNCTGNSGGHDYDWEHIVVQFNRTNWNRSTVTYFQHSGSFTKRLNSDHPTVFVGKVGHGSYDNSGGSGGCCYWADYRNPGDVVNAENHLYQLRCSNSKMAFNGDWGNSGKGPLYRGRDYWNFDPCEGSRLRLCTESGCYRSDYRSTRLGKIERGFN